MNILTVNLIFSTLVFWIASRLYLVPRLHELKPKAVLLPILLLHSLRHLGLMFLAPGAIYAGMPSQFAYPAAFGDLIAALLALAAIPWRPRPRRAVARTDRHSAAAHALRRAALYGAGDLSRT